MRGLLLEYTGTLLIVAAMFYTHGNPILIGLAYTAALFIAEGHSEGYFTPLGVLVQYTLGRLPSVKSFQLVGAQLLGAMSVVIIYMQFESKSK